MSDWPEVTLGDVMSLDLETVEVEPDATYDIVGVLNRGRGLLHREPMPGSDTAYRKLNVIRPRQVVYSRLKAFEGAITVVPDDAPASFASQEFPTFTCGPDLLPGYFALHTTTAALWERLQGLSTGMGGRRERVKPADFLTIRMLLPPLAEQRRIVDLVQVLDAHLTRLQTECQRLSDLADAVAADVYDAALEGAEFVPLELVVDRVKNGVMYKRGVSEGGWPVTRIETISTGVIRHDKTGREGFTSANAAGFELRAGDILFSNKNSLERVGTTALVREQDLPMINGDNLLQIRPSGVEPSYLFAVLRSRQLRRKIRSLTRPAVNQASVNARQVRGLPVPRPSAERQRRLGSRYLAILTADQSVSTELDAFRAVRSKAVRALVSQQLRISEAYDRFLEKVA